MDLEITIKNYINRELSELESIASVLEHYDILENDDDEVLICIKTELEGEESLALFFCDGGKHGLLFKGTQCLIICDCIHPSMQKKLPKVDKILCVEISNLGEINKEYIAKVVVHQNISELAELLIERLEKQRELEEDDTTIF